MQNKPSVPEARTANLSGLPPSEPANLHALLRTGLGDRFQFGELLGRGGMGAVYRAYDRELGQDVALKLLHQRSAFEREQLKSEFRALAGIVHPNLITLYELVIHEDLCLFTMELVRGVDFAKYVQASSPDAWAGRLRHAARQLAQALDAVHDGGKLHGDVKPSNVLVSAEGRVVLLDFGLTMPVPGDEPAQKNWLVGGTAEYMAPEQAWGFESQEGAADSRAPAAASTVRTYSGARPTPAADWYGFGAVLCEAVTGQPPIGALSRKVVTGKSQFVPHSLRSSDRDLPEDLQQLIVSLLQPVPESRPSGAAVLEVLGGDAGVDAKAGQRANDAEHVTLVGREPELAQLHELLRAVEAGTASIIDVAGTSGIGKSSLVREFLAQLQSTGRAHVLEARCHPREVVAFNALEDLVEGILPMRDQWSGPGPSGLALPHQSALVRVFPRLALALPGIRGESERHADPQEARLLAFAAMRAILERLAQAVPVVLWIDDAQWGDRDSGVALREILRAPGALRLMLILSYREEDAETSACLRTLAEPQHAASHLSREVLRLGPLTEAHGWQVLLESARGDAHASRQGLSRLVLDAEGSPFFLCQLGRYLKNHGSDSAEPIASIGLEEVLRRRTSDLSSAARVALEVFAVAGAPLEHSVALQAANIAPAERNIVAELERLSMLRMTDLKGRVSEIYHHRIRDEVLRDMPLAQRTGHHRAIGNAVLATKNPNALTAVEHFEAAGDLESVRRYVLTAAKQADRVLAFERAAKFYRRALDLEIAEMERHELCRHLGVALAAAGRSADAGEAFAEAAELLQADASSDPDRVLSMQQRAAEQFIEAGHYDRGLKSYEGLLTHLGISVPRSRREASVKSLVLRLVSTIRGVRLPREPHVAPSAAALRRYDAQWFWGNRLSMTDHTTAGYVVLRCALEAVAMGEPTRMMLALAGEAAFCGFVPGKLFRRRSEHLLSLSESLAQRHSGSYEHAYLLALRGIAVWFSAEFRKTLDGVDAAAEMLRRTSPGPRWEYGMWRLWALASLYYLGEIRELLERVHAAREEAERRDDRFAARVIDVGQPALAWLMEDQPDRAIEQADRVLEWAPTQYTTQHYQHYLSTLEAELYRGNAAEAWQRTLAAWPLLRKTLYLSTLLVRDELWYARARAALAMASALAPSPGSPRSAAGTDFLSLALRAARRLEAHAAAYGAGWALLVHAGIAYRRGQRDVAIAKLRQAEPIFGACQMQLYRQAVRYALGRLLANQEGALLARDAEGWMLGQGIQKPQVVARTLVPIPS